MESNKKSVPREWKDDERTKFMSLMKGGKSISDIAKKLRRSVDDIFEEMKRVMIVKLPEVPESEAPVTVRDKAKAMASAARQVARANGKRITMSMFFIEDL